MIGGSKLGDIRTVSIHNQGKCLLGQAPSGHMVILWDRCA